MKKQAAAHSSWNQLLWERARKAALRECTICGGAVPLREQDLVGRCRQCVAEAKIVKHKVTIVGIGERAGLGTYLVELGNRLIDQEAENGNEELVTLTESWGRVSVVVKRVEVQRSSGGASC